MTWRARGGVELGGWLVGDQQSGSSASARATATRCCWPPESSSTRWSANSASPTWSRAAAASGRREPRRPARCAQRCFDVLRGGQQRHQAVALEHDDEPGAESRRAWISVDQHLARRRFGQAREHGEQAGLARARTGR